MSEVSDIDLQMMVIDANKLAKAKYNGKMVKILCPYYNGQQCGRSREPQKGKVFEVIDTDVDSFNGVLLFIQYGWQCIQASKVRIIQEPNNG